MRLLGVIVTVALLAVTPVAQKDKWNKRTPMPMPTSDFTCTTVDQSILCVGGCVEGQVCPDREDLYCFCPNVTREVHAYTPDLDSWGALPSAPRPRYRHAAAALGGQLYLIGGRSTTDELIAEVDVYDTSTGTWETLSSPHDMPIPSSDLAAFLLDSAIHVVGGYDRHYSTLNAHQIFHTGNRSWTKGPPMGSARGDFTAVTIGGKGYVFGGFASDFCHPLDSLEVFDPPPDNDWRELKAMDTPRADKAGVALNGHFMVIGGEQKHSDPSKCEKLSVPVNDVESYSPKDDEWTQMRPIPSERMRFAGAAYGDSVYIFGGQGRLDSNEKPPTHPIYDTVEEYRLCDDGLQNGNELGVDCGGSCQPCTDEDQRTGVVGGDDEVYEVAFGGTQRESEESTSGESIPVGAGGVRLAVALGLIAVAFIDRM
ncbi:unnamed protein product [Vitrella brassicaformis CCMP3155]|uniref:Uncharacterized protein n=1 Tax=Vitrella brassicaformis (strain CCMP3155) TaxID=1169540 RepID=A0A0G4E8B0_VITBC|nr:unnamed protein product [Vitrella brassicaformis CCMP3155]|mmetsp:Transcript_82/g.287  ORF Transcript_82/g.287 Transcript_82/m.287 type:complete len:426 (+) Transcript_82:3-1280(+)|eukprot:CEL91635.1 unnamed protein product [Vitrella brassicaformis CCMP3155]